MKEVWLITSKAAFEALRARFGQIPSPIWLAGGVLTATEIESLRFGGADVSVFVDAIDPGDEEELADARDTVGLHHPGHVVRTA